MRSWRSFAELKEERGESREEREEGREKRGELSVKLHASEHIDVFMHKERYS